MVLLEHYIGVAVWLIFCWDQPATTEVEIGVHSVGHRDTVDLILPMPAVSRQIGSVLLTPGATHESPSM